MVVRFRPGALLKNHRGTPCGFLLPYPTPLMVWYNGRNMMNEEESHDKLDQLLDLTKENNRILRSMHRRMLWSQVFTFMYWLVILGTIGWSYYYLQPYISKYLNTYQSIMGSLSSMEEQSRSFPTDLQGLLEKVQ